MPDYVPSWINDCYTLLSKVNKCIEKTEEVLATLDRKQDELNTTQLSAVNSGITQAKVEHYDAIPIVVGNPTESGSVDLTKLKVGDTIYNIPSGGGSSAYLHRLYTGRGYTYFKTSFSTPITPQNAQTLFGFTAVNDWAVFSCGVAEIYFTSVVPYLYSFIGNNATLNWTDTVQETEWTDTVTEL